ncbi:hypothetical protein Bbelb_057860 [Branchiostoma belcheri]|nr:hypothetical protein Bbelb_057860 [Branchiostoma belcheri]
MSTLPVERPTSQTFNPQEQNETSPLYPDATSVTSTTESFTTSAPPLSLSPRPRASPRPPPTLHPALIALPPVVVVVALGVCATIGFKNLRQRRQRHQRRPPNPRGQCVNANYGCQQRDSYFFDAGTTQRPVVSGESERPQTEEPRARAMSSSCYNMASDFSSEATEYGAAARIPYSPRTHVRTNNQTYTNEEVFCGTPTVDADPVAFFADSSAYGHTDQAMSEDSLRHDSGSVSPLYKTSPDAIYHNFGETRTGNRPSEHDEH